MLMKFGKNTGRLHLHSSDYHLVVLQGAMKHWIEGEQEADEDKKGYPDDHHGLQAGGSLAGSSLLDWKRPEANAPC